MGGTLTRNDLDSVVIRGLYLNSPGDVSEETIAEHFKLDVTDVHDALLRLRRKRIARDRRRRGVRVWGPWR